MRRARWGMLLVLLWASLTAAACSDAEVPNAYYDAGAVFDAGLLGYRDQPCLNGRCINPNLDVCVQQGSGANQTLICREICEPVQADPCGEGRVCRSLTNGTGACLPANGVDEPCPCDDGLACVNYEVQNEPVDGGPLDAGSTIIRNTCKIECERNPDGTDTCGNNGRCRLFVGSLTDGVCIEQ